MKSERAAAGDGIDRAGDEGRNETTTKDSSRVGTQTGCDHSPSSAAVVAGSITVAAIAMPAASADREHGRERHARGEQQRVDRQQRGDQDVGEQPHVFVRRSSLVRCGRFMTSVNTRCPRMMPPTDAAIPMQHERPQTKPARAATP